MPNETKNKGGTTNLLKKLNNNFCDEAFIVGREKLTNAQSQSDPTIGTQIFDNRIVKLVWTIEDVAAELHCSVRHVRNLVSENKIPYFKVGRLVRFSPLRLREWLHKGGTR